MFQLNVEPNEWLVQKEDCGQSRTSLQVSREEMHWYRISNQFEFFSTEEMSTGYESIEPN